MKENSFVDNFDLFCIGREEYSIIGSKASLWLGPLVHLSIGRSVIIIYKNGGKFHFHAPIGLLVTILN